MSDIVIYLKEDGQAGLDVRLEQDTVWLNLNQIAELFDRDKSVISRHMKTIFDSGELDRNATVAKNATVQFEGKREVKRSIDCFNLDVIISVGYRVNSKRGVQFRQWATQVLRDQLVQGYSLNEQRLTEQVEKLKEVQQALDLLSRTLEQQQLVNNAGRDVLKVITDYAYALDLLDRYDHGTLAIEETGGSSVFVIDYAQAIDIVQSMKKDFDGLFGIEKDQGFKSALGTI